MTRFGTLSKATKAMRDVYARQLDGGLSDRQRERLERSVRELEATVMVQDQLAAMERAGFSLRDLRRAIETVRVQVDALMVGAAA